MKKICFLVLSGIFTLGCFVAQAQTTYNSITNNSGNLTFDDPGFWQGGVAPPATCDNCTIYINTNVTIVPGHIVLQNGSLLKINGVNITVTINAYIELFDSQFIIGSNSNSIITVLLNDQMDLNGTSGVRLGNLNCYINVNNFGTPPDFNSNPINGPHDDIFNPGTKSAGIFGIFSPADVNGYLYSYVLNANGIGRSDNIYPTSDYLLNCVGGPITCNNGIVIGPAATSPEPPYGVTFQQSTVLPVQLVQFLASKNPDASVKLSWSTAQEINSSSFEVERSADQGSWDKIGSVAAKGYSSITTDYSFTDRFPLSGNGYYRLKMIDLDGKFKYSNTLVVSSDKDSRPLVIYSNPFSDQIRMKVNVSKAQNLSLTVSDMLGKTYLKQSYNAQAGENLINMVPAGAASGVYILHIQGSTYEQTVKLVKH
jgi:hypothetical protein